MEKGQTVTLLSRYFFSLLLLVFVVFGNLILKHCGSRLLGDLEIQENFQTPSHYGGLYKPPTTFKEFVAYFKKLLPFIWPGGRENWRLQLCILGSFGFLVIGRCVNVLVPYQYKVVIESFGDFNGGNGTVQNILSMIKNDDAIELFKMEKFANFPWNQISLFVFLRFLQGGVGLLSTLQGFLWIRVGQYTTRVISIKMFEHLHALSMSYHLSRKTGEILRIQGKSKLFFLTLFL